MAVYREMRERIEALPGVRAVSLSLAVPPGGGGFQAGDVVLQAEGRDAPVEEPPFMVPFAEVDATFLDVLEIPLLAGRSLRSDDAEQNGLVIDSALADAAIVPPAPVAPRPAELRKGA